MPGVVRFGDICSGHGCWVPRPNIMASTNVLVNGLGVHRATDKWAIHACAPPHDGFAVPIGPMNVLVNGLPVAKIGDPVSCGSTMVTGSPNVMVN